MNRPLIRDLAYSTAIGVIIAVGAYLTASPALPFWPLVAIMTSLFVAAGLLARTLPRRTR